MSPKIVEHPSDPMPTGESRDDWDQHWAEHSVSSLAEANPAQRYRRQLICDLLGESCSKRPGRIVDLGSGNGDLLADLSTKIPSVGMLGVERSAVGIEIAARKVPRASFLQQDLLQPIPTECAYRGWADYAICSEVLEHLNDPSSFLINASALMSPGCKLIVTVPGGPMSAFDRHIGHRKHFSVVELRDLLEQSGFSVKVVRGAGFPFFNLYRLVVILRGNALVEDVSHDPPGLARLAGSLLTRLFRGLFAFNRNQGRLGWQIVATAEMDACNAALSGN